MASLLTTLNSFTHNGALRSAAKLIKILTRNRCKDIIVLPQSIGKILPTRGECEGYQAGQLFVHRVFPYRGIIACTFRCNMEEKCGTPRDIEPTILKEEVFCYQALVHSGDWRCMGFPADITSYLESSGDRKEKVHTVLYGMDCVSHNDIIPYETTDLEPINHDFFPKIFEVSQNNKGIAKFALKKNQEYVTTNKYSKIVSQLSPHHIYRQTTDDVRVTVTTFYLGVSNENQQHKHWWRYVIKLENLGKFVVFARSREMKVYSLTNMQQRKEAFSTGKKELQFPRLTPENPSFQYSGILAVAVDRGSYAWGNFTMERENDRAAFMVRVPTFRLESTISNGSTPPEQTEEVN